MDQSPALDIVNAYQDAWTSRDFEAARQYVSDDITFHSPGQEIAGARDFFGMLGAFAQRIEPRWKKVAATTQGDNVLILYHLFMPDGTPAFCADYFQLEGGKIKSETLVFDPDPFTAAARRQA